MWGEDRWGEVNGLGNYVCGDREGQPPSAELMNVPFTHRWVGNPKEDWPRGREMVEGILERHNVIFSPPLSRFPSPMDEKIIMMWTNDWKSCWGGKDAGDDNPHRTD